MTSPSDYLRLALEPTRLAVLGHAAAGPVDVNYLAEALDVDRRRVLMAVAQLRAAGLLTDTGRLDRWRLRQLGAALPKVEPPAQAVVEGPWTAEEAEILARFFEGSRLRQIPAQRSKRLVVLERLAQEFEPGIRYPERQVNFTLQVFHPDYASLRRYLVDEGFLTRAEGVYWRTGGRGVD
jgi:biotin operon repressor